MLVAPANAGLGPGSALPAAQPATAPAVAAHPAARSLWSGGGQDAYPDVEAATAEAPPTQGGQLAWALAGSGGPAATCRTVPALVGTLDQARHHRAMQRSRFDHLGRQRGTAVLLGLISGACAATATWGLVGDVSEPGGYLRILPAPELSRPVELGMGVVGAAVVLAILALLWRSSWRRPLPKHASEIVLILTVLGVLTAGAGRVLSSRTDGANIGGGMILMVSPFALIGILVVLVRGWRHFGQA